MDGGRNQFLRNAPLEHAAFDFLGQVVDVLSAFALAPRNAVGAITAQLGQTVPRSFSPRLPAADEPPASRIEGARMGWPFFR